MSSQTPSSSTPSPGDVELPATELGTCTILTDRHLLDAKEISCDEPHDHVLFAAGSIEVSASSSASEITDATQAFCTDEFKRLSGVDARLTVEALTFDFLEPEPFDLDLGLATAGCVVFFPEDVTVPLAEIDPERAFGATTGQALAVGDCTNTDDFGAREFELVDCSDPHTMEVFHTLELDGAEFPGVEQLGDQMDGICGPLFAEQFTDADGVILSYKRPSEVTWLEADDRAASCIAVAPELLS